MINLAVEHRAELITWLEDRLAELEVDRESIDEERPDLLPALSSLLGLLQPGSDPLEQIQQLATELKEYAKSCGIDAFSIRLCGLYEGVWKGKHIVRSGAPLTLDKATWVARINAMRDTPLSLVDSDKE